MRNIKNATTMICALLMLFNAHTSFGQRIVTTNSIFAEGDSTYEFWIDAGGGTGNLTTDPNGTLSAEWNDALSIRDFKAAAAAPLLFSNDQHCCS